MVLLGGSGLPWLCLDPNEGLPNAKTMERRYSATYQTKPYQCILFLDLSPFLPKKTMKTCTPHNCINCQMSQKFYKKKSHQGSRGSSPGGIITPSSLSRRFASPRSMLFMFNVQCIQYILNNKRDFSQFLFSCSASIGRVSRSNSRRFF